MASIKELNAWCMYHGKSILVHKGKQCGAIKANGFVAHRIPKDSNAFTDDMLVNRPVYWLAR